MWKLPGVEVCDETSVVVRSSQGRLIKWYCLKVHIHQDSLPEGLDQCTVHIKVSLAGEYEIPDCTELITPIYWLKCEPPCIFTKPITVEINHGIGQELKIVGACSDQKQLPYNFKPLGGRFVNDADYGSGLYGIMEVKTFSGLGFGITGESPVTDRLYHCRLFYRYRSEQLFDIHIAFVWNTGAYIEVYIIAKPIIQLLP